MNDFNFNDICFDIDDAVYVSKQEYFDTFVCPAFLDNKKLGYILQVIDACGNYYDPQHKIFKTKTSAKKAADIETLYFQNSF